MSDIENGVQQGSADSEPGAAISKRRTRRQAKSQRGVFEKVPGSGVWWVRHTDTQGVLHREKVGAWSKACKLYEIRRAEAREGKQQPKNMREKRVTFKAIADDALAWSKNHKRSYRSDVSIHANLVKLFGERPADSLLGHEIEATLEAEARANGWKDSTFNHHRSFMMMAYREAKRRGVVFSNPARDARHHRENNKRVRWLERGPKSEYERLSAVITAKYPQHLAEFIFALSTGLRLSSQYGATYEMINWSRLELTIPRTKNDEPLTISLNETALKALKMLPTWEHKEGFIFPTRDGGRPIESNCKSYFEWFRDALKEAEIKNFRWHDLRHTLCSWQVQDGIPIERVAKSVGHTSKYMTERYAHLAPSQLAADMALLSKTINTIFAPEPAGQEQRIN